MNENIDLTKILKDCPKGTILYSLIHGYVEFSQILEKGSRVIEVISITRSGKRYVEHYTFRGQLDSVYDNVDGNLQYIPSDEVSDDSRNYYTIYSDFNHNVAILMVQETKVERKYG